jgi:hypothetical protein
VISGSNIAWTAYVNGNYEIFALLPEMCYPVPAADITGDCRVNFMDFAALLSEWLVCHKQPQSLCD